MIGWPGFVETSPSGHLGDPSGAQSGLPSKLLLPASSSSSIGDGLVSSDLFHHQPALAEDAVDVGDQVAVGRPRAVDVALGVVVGEVRQPGQVRQRSGVDLGGRRVSGRRLQREADLRAVRRDRGLVLVDAGRIGDRHLGSTRGGPLHDVEVAVRRRGHLLRVIDGLRVGAPGGLELGRTADGQRKRGDAGAHGLDHDVAVGAVVDRLMLVGDPGAVGGPRRVVRAESIPDLGRVEGGDRVLDEVVDVDVVLLGRRRAGSAGREGDLRPVGRPGRVAILDARDADGRTEDVPAPRGADHCPQIDLGQIVVGALPAAGEGDQAVPAGEYR